MDNVFCSSFQQLLDAELESSIYKVQWIQVQEQYYFLKEFTPWIYNSIIVLVNPKVKWKYTFPRRETWLHEMLACDYSVLEEMTGNLVKYLFYDQTMYDWKNILVRYLSNPAIYFNYYIHQCDE